MNYDRRLQPGQTGPLSLTNKVLPSDCQALPYTDIPLTSLGEAPAPLEEEKQLMTVRVRMEPPW